MPPDTRNAPENRNALTALTEVQRSEWPVLALAMVYFFLLMAGYFILRPIRDQMGVAGGIGNLPWLFTATLLAMLALNPLFSALVARTTRRRLVSISYRLLMLCLLGFYAALNLLPDTAQVWVGRAFFVWASVFNLFAVSLFWAVMADVFDDHSARRLYGLIAAGGTLGALIGGLVTTSLVETLGAAGLLLVSLVLLELALRCMFALTARVASSDPAQQRRGDQIVGGSTLDGLTMAVRSPYLLGVCGYMLLYTIGSTFLYFLQAGIVASEIDGAARQTAYFATVDIWVNGLTLAIQLLATGRIMARLGVGLTLAALPLISLVGFAGLGLWPTLAAVVVFTVARRTSNFALSRPAREALYVPLSRIGKYKAKNFIDTFVYRLGDQIGAWSNGLLLWLGLGVTGIATTALPLAGAWLLLALWLGRKHQSLIAAEPAPNRAPEHPSGPTARP